MLFDLQIIFQDICRDSFPVLTMKRVELIVSKILIHQEEKFEENKGVIRSRQYNGTKNTHHGRPNATQDTND